MDDGATEDEMRALAQELREMFPGMPEGADAAQVRATAVRSALCHAAVDTVMVAAMANSWPVEAAVSVVQLGGIVAFGGSVDGEDDTEAEARARLIGLLEQALRHARGLEPHEPVDLPPPTQWRDATGTEAERIAREAVTHAGRIAHEQGIRVPIAVAAVRAPDGGVAVSAGSDDTGEEEDVLEVLLAAARRVAAAMGEMLAVKRRKVGAG